MIYDAFLSYSRADTTPMNRVRNALQAAGLKVWVDDALTPGTDIWEREIERAIAESHTVVVLLSPDAHSSKWVRREIVQAEELSKRIIPLIVRASAENGGDVVPLSLKATQRIDLRKGEEKGINQLVQAFGGRKPIEAQFLPHLEYQLLFPLPQPSTTDTRKHADAASPYTRLEVLQFGMREILNELCDVHQGWFSSPNPRLEDIKGWLERSLIHISIAGDFFVGKTTLANALVGMDVLPSKVLIGKSTPVIIRWGEALRAVLYPSNGEPPFEIPLVELKQYMSPELRPDTNDPPFTEQPYQFIELFMPVALLRNGVALAEYPPLERMKELYSRVTVPSVLHPDLVVLVINATQSMRLIEREFIETFADNSRLIIVINKTDQVLDNEIDSLKKYVLKAVGDFPQEHIFFISARDALQARLSGDEILLQKSNLPALESAIVSFVAAEGERTRLGAIPAQIIGALSEIEQRVEWSEAAIQANIKSILQNLEAIRQGNLALNTDVYRAIEEQRAVATRFAADKAAALLYLAGIRRTLEMLINSNR